MSFVSKARCSSLVLAALTFLNSGIAQSPAGKATTEPPQAAATTPAELKEALVFESNHTKVTYQEDGSDVREVTAVIKVLSQAGVQGLAVLPFSYTSANETVEFDYVRVRKSDGTVVVTPEYNIQDMPADVTRGAPMYSDIHEKHVTVKALGVGDTLEYLVRYRTTKPQVPGQFWFAYNFKKDIVVKDEQLIIDVPRDKYVKVSSPDFEPQIKDEANRRIYTWKTSNLERKNESKLKTAKQPVPTPSVQITTFRNWEEVGHWYGELARSQVVVTPQIQAKATELIKGLSSDADKMRALYEFVSTRYHYVSLSFGIGRYQPHPAEDIFENEYGDCKDKHTLLAALLKAAGYEAWPALINASSMKIDANLPSPGQFDHVITVVPRQDESLLWLDTTPGVAPFGLLITTLRDRQALVIPTDKPAHLVTTPENPPFEEKGTFRSKGKLSSDGTLTAHMDMSAYGDNAVLERYIFQNYPEPKWKDMVQQMSYVWGFMGEVSKIDVSELSNIDKPIGLSYDYKREKYSDWENGRISAPLPPVIDSISDDAKKPDDPVFLGAPGVHDYIAEIELPADKQKVVPPSNLKLAEDFAEYNSTYEVKNGVLIAKRQLTIKKSHVPLSDWEKYKSFTKFVASDRDSWVQLGEAKSSDGHATNPDADRAFQEGDEALQRRDITRAQESFSRVLELDPKYPGAHGNLGLTYLSSGNMDEGIRELKKEEEVNPDDTIAHLTLSRVYAFKHDNPAAIEQLQQLLKVDPKNRDAALNLGQLLSSEKRYPEALAVLQKASDQAPDSGAVKYELGYAYIRSGDKEKGLAILQEALKNDQARDRDTLALNNVAYSLIEMDTGMDVAAQYAEKSLQQQQAETLKATTDRAGFATTSGIDAVWDTVGWVYFKQGQYEKALPYLKAAWILGQQAQVGDHLGQTYAKLGKKMEAAHTFQLAYEANRLSRRTPGVNKLNDTIKEHYQAASGKPLNQPAFPSLKPNKPGAAVGDSPAEELSRMREVKLTTTSHPAATGTFTIVFSQGGVDEVRQVDGGESLKSLSDRIKAAKFQIEFPNTNPAKLRRKGIVTCGGLGCDMTLMPIDDQSLFSQE